MLPVSTRDSNGRETFIPIPLEIHLTSGYVGDESIRLNEVNYTGPYKNRPESMVWYGMVTLFKYGISVARIIQFHFSTLIQ